MKKLLVMLLVLVLALPCAPAALGEATVFQSMQPLMDLTASAAMRVGETPESITEGGTLSQAFVYNFFMLGQQADPALGITADLLADPQQQAAYLSRAFAAAQPQLSGILPQSEAYDYIGIRVMAADENPDGTAMKILGDVYQASGPLEGMSEEEYTQVRWLDQRAVVEMRRDENAPGGWKLYSFALDEELQMENAVQAYFTQTMVEYINTALGYAIQYPAVFGDSMVRDEPTGLSAALPDGSASFFVRCEDNAQGLTLAQLAAQKQQENPAAQANMIDMTGCVRLTSTEGDATRVDLYLVTPSSIYHAQLWYQVQHAVDFALYSDYMMNSFTADELGIG